MGFRWIFIEFSATFVIWNPASIFSSFEKYIFFRQNIRFIFREISDLNIDSINEGLLLPTVEYVPGHKLPPHLSPFQSIKFKSYVPHRRSELDKVKEAAANGEVYIPQLFVPKMDQKVLILEQFFGVVD